MPKMIEEMDKKLQEEKSELLSKSYDIIMRFIKTDEFKEWVDSVQDNLSYDYDYYHQNCVDNNAEPLGFEVWALGRFLDESN